METKYFAMAFTMTLILSAFKQDMENTGYILQMTNQVIISA